MSPQSPDQPPKDVNLEDRVLMTLGKMDDLDGIAKECQPNFDQMNQILKHKEYNIEKMKDIMV